MLTVKALRAMRAGKWISDGAVRGSGALWARGGESGGTSFYFRYSHEGKKKAIALGGYDETGAKGLTLPEARERAKALSKLYGSGITDLHGHLERERQAAVRQRVAEQEAAKRAAQDAQRGTLRQLLESYVAHLERLKKQSAKDVAGIFKNHVFELKAAADIADRKAASLSVDDFVGLIGRLVEADKGRTADKLRSYLRAAYQLAIESKTNPAAPLALRAFGITVNSIGSIGALSQFNRARDRTLAAPELGALLRRIDTLQPGAQRDALQLCLLLGGQRPMQLLRMKAADVDLSAGTVTLYDGKGARSQPRRHVLPLVKDAAAILERRLESAGDAPLFSTDERTVMRSETLSALVADISDAMVKAKEAREKFQLRDLRRTAETMLASLKVSSDVRAQLQSHGLGGVQARHYDKHSYSAEKLLALTKWAKHLAALKAGKQAEVVAISGKRRAAHQEAPAS
jgi:integrase